MPVKRLYMDTEFLDVSFKKSQSLKTSNIRAVLTDEDLREAKLAAIQAAKPTLSFAKVNMARARIRDNMPLKELPILQLFLRAY